MQAQTAAESRKPGVSLNPSKIMQIGMGFWPSKVLLTAVKFQLFTRLGERSLSGKEVKEKLGLNCADRHVYDWLDTLVSLGLLDRSGLLEDAIYSNSEDTGFFLDKNKPSYMGGILEMADARLYNHWRFLDEGLQTGLQQNEGKGSHHGNMEFFTELYKDENKLKEFVNAMRGIQTGNFMALTEKFDFSQYKRFLDIGGADGWLSIQIALHHPAIQCTTFDLPPVQPLAEKLIAHFHLTDRIRVVSGDFLTDPFPATDVIAMGNILHGMNEEAKEQLLKKVYDALPDNGAFIAIENIIDEQRNTNTFGLLMSLNMLIENGDAFDYTLADFSKWAKKAGFSRIESTPLTGPASAAVAYK
jgi:hypothetical protein